MKIFGFQITRKKEEEALLSFSEPTADDGAQIVGTADAFVVDFNESSGKSEIDLITHYRQMEMTPEADKAINEIVCEAIIELPEKPVVSINLDKTHFKPAVKKRIVEEFDQILSIIQFNRKPYDIFRRWYVDGKIVYDVVVDPKQMDRGILELRNVDPRKIQKIRRIKEVDQKGMKQWPTNFPSLKTWGDEYYKYSPSAKTISPHPTTSEMIGSGEQLIAKDSVVYVTSGLLTPDNKKVLGYLSKAIKPANQLQMLEDATVIYRVTRAPERLIFYVDVGNLSAPKAERAIRRLSSQYKQKISYNIETGEVVNSRRFMSMMDNFWFPRREGGRATEVQSLPSGQNLGEITDVLYFKEKLYEALNLPKSRIDVKEAIFSVGKPAEVLRDELKFQKFVYRVRSRFSELFNECLDRQLILRNVMTPEEWEQERSNVTYNFTNDNEYAELKAIEILREKVTMINEIEPLMGRYFSQAWVKRNVLKQTDEEIEQMAKEMDFEKENAPKDDVEGDIEGGGGGGGGGGFG